MDFAMSKSVSVRIEWRVDARKWIFVGFDCHAHVASSRVAQIFWSHDNHCSFFFLRIQVLNDAGFEKIPPSKWWLFPLLNRKTSLSASNGIVYSLDVSLVQDQVAIIVAGWVGVDHEERTDDSACITRDLKFLVSNIPDKTELRIDCPSSTQLPEVVDKEFRIPKDYCKPYTV